MAKNHWFDKYIGCAFYLFDDMTGGNAGEYIFSACVNTPTMTTNATRCNTNFAPTINRKYYCHTKTRGKLWAQ